MFVRLSSLLLPTRFIIPTTTKLNLHRRSMSSISGPPQDPISPSTTRIGWIGTGVMGRSMCAHLISAGYTVTVFNRTPSKAHPLLQMGAQLAASPQSLAASSHVVFTIVGYPSDVRSVILSPSGVLSALPAAATVVDMTTSDPSLAVEIAAAASARGCSAVDAPVSGGDRGAREGKLAIFAGGEEGVVRRLAPLFQSRSRRRWWGSWRG
ncbi:hypothetical protein AAC387_Pa03g0713 [Persea americana]